MERTISAWIKVPSNSDYAIASWGTNNSGKKYTFRVQTNNGTKGAIRTEVNGGYVVGNKKVGDGQWHHVATVLKDYNENGLNVRDHVLYVDGEIDGDWTGTFGGPSTSAASSESIDTADTESVKIGNDHSNRYFSGFMDEIAIFNRALTPQEIKDIYNMGTP